MDAFSKSLAAHRSARNMIRPYTVDTFTATPSPTNPQITTTRPTTPDLIDGTSHTDQGTGKTIVTSFVALLWWIVFIMLSPLSVLFSCATSHRSHFCVFAATRSNVEVVRRCSRCKVKSVETETKLTKVRMQCPFPMSHQWRPQKTSSPTRVRTYMQTYIQKGHTWNIA